MGGEDHAGGADAALGSALFEEALLNGMEFLADDEAFDGGDFGALGLQDGDEAGVDQIAVDEDGAGSALAFAASLFGPGEVQVFAEDVEEPLHRWGFDGFWVAVDGELDDAHAVASLKMGPAMSGFKDSVPASGMRVICSKMSSGSRGISLKEMLVACSMALRMAGAGPSMGSSPMPLAPPGP